MADPKKEHPPHALDDLVARVGKNNPKLLEALLEGSSNEQLVGTGASIATSRLVVDGLRLYGEALDFLDGASPAQTRTLRGVSLALLGVAVHHLDMLRKLEVSTSGASESHTTARVVVDEEVRIAATSAIAVRDQAYEALRDAGSSPARRKAVDEAFGVADPPDVLAAGLDNTSALLTQWLQSDDAALKARLTLANLDKAFATELAEAALAVRAAVAVAAKRTSPKAMQAALDREDGVQTLLLGQIIRAFEGAHGRDATIPRLVPISTRRLFNRNTKKPAAEEEPKTP